MGVDERQYILENLTSIFWGEGDTFIKRYLARDRAFHAHFPFKVREFPNSYFGKYCAILCWPSTEILELQDIEGAEVVFDKATESPGVA